MIIKALSDTHNRHDEISARFNLECDILIHAGDAGVRGNFTEIENFYKWYVKQPAKYKLFVPGNHDKSAKKHKLLHAMAEEYGIIVLRNSGVTINGKTFWGCGDVAIFDKMGNYRQPTHPNNFQLMPLKLDVLVTHCPAQYLLDFGGIRYQTNLGCPRLRAELDSSKRDVKTMIHGHIHEEGGNSLDHNGTVIYNVACMDRNYEIVRGPKEIII